MAASANHNAKPFHPGGIVRVPLDGTSQTIYKHSLVMFDATGYAVSGADTASCIFAGVAVDKVVLTTETDGTSEIEVYTEGEFLYTYGAGSLAITIVGDAVYITDDITVDLAGTTTNDIPIGFVSRWVDADTCYVKINAQAGGQVVVHA